MKITRREFLKYTGVALGSFALRDFIYPLESQATLPFTVTKYSGNPVLVPTGINGDYDEATVRDASFIKVGGIYNILYTSWTDVKGASMRATSNSPFGPYTRQGVYYPTSGTTIDGAPGNPFILYTGGKWHAWGDVIPKGYAGTWRRSVCYMSQDGSADTIPSSFSWGTERLIDGDGTGWTAANTSHCNNVGGIAGVSTPKVYPKDGGGWIMFLCATDCSVAYYGVGYATATDIAGPWTVNTASQVIAGGSYLAEQIAYFTYNGKHYLITNQVSTLTSDLWQCDTQTGIYTLAQTDFIPKGTGSQWDASQMGVVALEGYNLNNGILYGLYDAIYPTHNWDRKIGIFTLTAPSISGASINLGTGGSIIGGTGGTINLQ